MGSQRTQRTELFCKASLMRAVLSGTEAALSGHPLVGSVAAVLAKCQGLFNKQMWTQLSLYMTSCDGPETAFFNAKRYQAITLNHYCNTEEVTLHPKSMIKHPRLYWLAISLKSDLTIVRTFLFRPMTQSIFWFRGTPQIIDMKIKYTWYNCIGPLSV